MNRKACRKQLNLKSQKGPGTMHVPGAAFRALLLLGLFLAVRTVAAPAFDTSTPASFFTNVADLVLRNETARWQAQDFADFTNTFGATTTNAFGLANLPVYVNGAFVYSSSVQRLLQVTANIYDATSTNACPSVFRPTFYRDPVSGNVFINGCQLVASVSGMDDPALESPVDIAAIVNGDVTNLSNINVYGVPWIIGARKGLPGFNEFNMLNVVQVTRLLQVNRNSTNPSPATVFTTNQMYVMSISNTVGVSLWNSYNTNYVGSGNLQVFMQDTLRMTLTNQFNTRTEFSNFNFSANLSSWPGSAWTYAPASNPAPVSESFIYTNWTFPLLSPSAYQYSSGLFIPISQPPASLWSEMGTYNFAFPPFGLMTTNWVQAFILDGSNVIDYVQFSGPNSTRNLTAELRDPNYPDATAVRYMWSTNAYGNSVSGIPTWGEANQILVSRGFGTPPPGGTWVTTAVFGGNDGSPAAQQAFFAGFWMPTFSYNGLTYANTQYSVQAPYTPTRTMYACTLWQANDPLVHYLASDLNYISTNTGVLKSDLVPPVFNVVGLNLNQLGNRFQPWGLTKQMAGLAGVDTNAYNLAFKDPLVWGSDYWNFPTNQTWNPNWLGNVHRGTPWQTIYLKSTNILAEIGSFENGFGYAGTNTWLAWSGVPNGAEAGRTSPVNDWHLAGLLATLLNTNASTPFFSVNNPDPNAWAVELDGLTAWTNTSPGDAIILTSNSPAVAALAAAIQTTRANQPGQLFSEVGNLFATPALTVQSPFLSGSDTIGISDADYEQIPDQLLALLGMNSLGAMAVSNGGIRVQFSGGDGHVYAVQTSADLIHWATLSTNTPVNNQFNILLPVVPAGAAQFYRSLLLQ